MGDNEASGGMWFGLFGIKVGARARMVYGIVMRVHASMCTAQIEVPDFVFLFVVLCGCLSFSHIYAVAHTHKMWLRCRESTRS